MDEKKQIEEMSCKRCVHYDVCVYVNAKAVEFARAENCKLFKDNAGYRKQIVGEWKLGKSGCMYFCSSCGYSAFPREEEEWNFCPRCGTKMKGGAE